MENIAFQSYHNPSVGTVATPLSCPILSLSSTQTTLSPCLTSLHQPQSSVILPNPVTELCLTSLRQPQSSDLLRHEPGHKTSFPVVLVCHPIYPPFVIRYIQHFTFSSPSSSCWAPPGHLPRPPPPASSPSPTSTSNIMKVSSLLKEYV
jgi:hypothetical protein